MVSTQHTVNRQLTKIAKDLDEKIAKDLDEKTASINVSIITE